MKVKNYGIDLLRIVAMFFVVILHQLLISGGLVQEDDTAVYNCFWLMEIIAYGATDLFGLISGYVGYREEKKKYKASSLIFIWIQAIFYNIIITLLFKIFSSKSIAWRDVIYSAFPVLTDQYWYLTAYIGLFMFIPVLDAAVQNLSKKKLLYLLGILIIGFSAMPTFTSIDFELVNGYSCLWLMILYFFGAAIRKCELDKRVTVIQGGIIWFGLLIATWVLKISGIDFRIFLGMNEIVCFNGDALISYCSPSVLISCVLLLMIFSGLRIPDKNGRRISYISSGTFAVYLINSNQYVWTYILPWIQNFMKEKSIIWLMTAVILFSLLFLVSAICVDLIRRKVFSLTKINQAILSVDDLLKKLILLEKSEKS